jgi:hypothetical protein
MKLSALLSRYKAAEVCRSVHRQLFRQGHRELITRLVSNARDGMKKYSPPRMWTACGEPLLECQKNQPTHSQTSDLGASPSRSQDGDLASVSQWDARKPESSAQIACVKSNCDKPKSS